MDITAGRWLTFPAGLTWIGDVTIHGRAYVSSVISGWYWSLPGPCARMFLLSEMHTNALLLPLSLFCSTAQRTAWLLPLHLVGNYVQLHALAPLHFFSLHKMAHANISWAQHGFFVCFVKSKLPIISENVFVMYFSSMVHIASVARAPAFFMCFHVSVQLSDFQPCWPDLHVNITQMFNLFFDCLMSSDHLH